MPWYRSCSVRYPTTFLTSLQLSSEQSADAVDSAQIAECTPYIHINLGKFSRSASLSIKVCGIVGRNVWKRSILYSVSLSYAIHTDELDHWFRFTSLFPLRLAYCQMMKSRITTKLVAIVDSWMHATLIVGSDTSSYLLSEFLVIFQRPPAGEHDFPPTAWHNIRM